MKITELWKTENMPTLSFELIPPKTPEEEAKFSKPIDKILALSPDFISITFGAGGTTRTGSAQLADKIKNQKNIEVLSYFAGYGLSPDIIKEILTGFQQIGIENILAVRGDMPREAEGFSPSPDSFAHASDLISFIRPKFPFCIGAAGYPEGHIQAESRDMDLEYLKRKVENGADFIICNYFYDNDFFFNFVDRCRSMGIEVPILPGVMPVYSIKMMKILAGLCGATLTDRLLKGISSLPEEDKDALVDFGIDFAVDQCRGLLQAGASGLHFYTMNRSKSVTGIVTRLKAEGLLSG